MTVTIAHVNVARGYRGGERQTELLIRGLAGRELRQVLVARRGGELARRFADVDVEVREVRGGFLSVARATRDASIVQVHEGRSVYGAYLRKLLSGTPYVVTRRVNNPIRQHGFARKAYRSAAIVVGVAPEVASIVQAYDPAIDVTVIHSASSGLAVNTARSREIREAFRDSFLVGHVGALDNAQKGQEHIIAVAKALEASHPDIQFLLVGGGADEAMLKDMAKDLTNVHFTGHVNNVGDYLAALDVFILPSNREGIGSILLDAMEQRLPVIASRVGGVPDIVRDGENGLLIDAARPDQLRDAILALRASPERRQALGARGREVVKAFTADIMVQKYLDLYRAVLGSLE